MVSWKTTLGGALGALGAFFTLSEDPILKVIGTIVSAAGTFILGLAARDNKVTSEQANAGK